MIDTHCHLDFPIFDADRAELVQRMQAIGVSDVVIPAVSAATWQRVKTVADAFPQLHACYGLHPMFLAEHRDEHIALLRAWLEKERPLAVGECGLDFFVPELSTPEAQHRQIMLFEAHLQCAQDYDLPLIIHVRKALDVVLKYIRRYPGIRGVIHSFSGSVQQAQMLCDHGFLLGVGGTITYDRAQKLRRVIAAMSQEALLLETDAPDQPDSEWRTQKRIRNDPTRLPVIAAALATVRGESLHDVVTYTTANACRLFGLDERERI